MKRKEVWAYVAGELYEGTCVLTAHPGWAHGVWELDADTLYPVPSSEETLDAVMAELCAEAAK
jgi:hypothetical protein